MIQYLRAPNPSFHSTVAYRHLLRKAVGQFREHELVSQDLYLWFDKLPHCRARNLTAPLIRYRCNPQGFTVRNTANNPRDRTQAIREVGWARLGLTN